MPKNKIIDLRNHMFDTIERLLDEENPMDLDRAETVAKVGQVIVNTAKVESDFLRHIGSGQSKFFENQQQLNEIATPIQPKQLSEASCFEHAAKFGHVKKTAEECENFSVGCPNCPFTTN